LIAGALIVDKPRAWTSHDVVNRVRRIFGERAVGHLGTLDPLATGVLPLLIGRATRLAKFYGRSLKTYEAVVRFGFSTDTYDADGVPSSDVQVVDLDRDRLERALQAFRGLLQQVPPPHSAKKIGGAPAYKLARKNQPVFLSPVEVEITRLDLLSSSGDTAALLIDCSAGTYVRSLAHDLGRMLGCGAHLAALRRTRSGDFYIKDAHSLKQLEELGPDGQFSAVLPTESLLPQFPAVVADAVTASHIRQGRNFPTSPFLVHTGSRFVRALTETGSLLAIGEAVLPNLYHPIVVLG